MNNISDARFFLAKIKNSGIAAEDFLMVLGNSRISNADFNKIKNNPRLTGEELALVLENSRLNAKDYLKMLTALGFIEDDKFKNKKNLAQSFSSDATAAKKKSNFSSRFSSTAHTTPAVTLAEKQVQVQVQEPEPEQEQEEFPNYKSLQLAIEDDEYSEFYDAADISDEEYDEEYTEIAPVRESVYDIEDGIHPKYCQIVCGVLAVILIFSCGFLQYWVHGFVTFSDKSSALYNFSTASYKKFTESSEIYKFLENIPLSKEIPDYSFASFENEYYLPETSSDKNIFYRNFDGYFYDKVFYKSGMALVEISQYENIVGFYGDVLLGELKGELKLRKFQQNGSFTEYIQKGEYLLYDENHKTLITRISLEDFISEGIDITPDNFFIPSDIKSFLEILIIGNYNGESPTYFAVACPKDTCYTEVLPNNKLLVSFFSSGKTKNYLFTLEPDKFSNTALTSVVYGKTIAAKAYLAFLAIVCEDDDSSLKLTIYSGLNLSKTSEISGIAKDYEELKKNIIFTDASVLYIICSDNNDKDNIFLAGVDFKNIKAPILITPYITPVPSSFLQLDKESFICVEDNEIAVYKMITGKLEKKFSLSLDTVSYTNVRELVVAADCIVLPKSYIDRVSEIAEFEVYKIALNEFTKTGSIFFYDKGYSSFGAEFDKNEKRYILYAGKDIYYAEDSMTGLSIIQNIGDNNNET